MPYILLKRSDVENGVLQIVDLLPNTSQRNSTIDPPGQSKYVRVPLNERLVTVGAGPSHTYVESRGLGAWFLTNVAGNAAPVAASQLGAVGGGGFLVGETVTIGATTFTAVAGAPAVNEFTVVGAQLADIISLVGAINDPLNGTNGIVTAVDEGLGSLSVTAVTPGTAGNLIVLNDNSIGFLWAGPTLLGGSDTTSLTASQASTMATNIMTNLLRFGVNASPSLAMGLAAVNAQIAAIVATASITAQQLLEILDILSGRLYVLPQGTQITDASSNWVVSPAVGTEEGPRFIDLSFRRSYESDSFVISWSEGSLSKFKLDSFTYKDVAGALVGVYNDDGSLYTPPV